MHPLELFLVSLSLSADSFAGAVAFGSNKNMTWNKAPLLALIFACMQAGMLWCGSWFGMQIAERMSQYDHWIAFVLLAFIGYKMLLESREHEETETNLHLGHMLFLGFATSIDALALGAGYAFMYSNLNLLILSCGASTLGFTLVGFYVGKQFGHLHEKRALFWGGVVLIALGLKILIQHLSA